MPLVVGVDQIVDQRVTRRYYAWLLGPVIKLPFESQRVEQTIPMYLSGGVQYFAPDTEFKLSHEAAAMKVYQGEQAALEANVTIALGEDGGPTADFDLEFTQDNTAADQSAVIGQ